ncbi:MAG: cysteine hydrolase [Rhodobacteraceae bacterium]|nr:cysteine hydrolase [Paracoccaceae bacterium]
MPANATGPICPIVRPPNATGQPGPAHRRSRSDGPYPDRRRTGRRNRAGAGPRPGELVIDKPGKGAFHATGLGDHLASLGIEALIFAGVTTEVCVQTTMREANDRGYDGLLAEDATESYFPNSRRRRLP